MAVRSKRIELYAPAKLAQVNPENLRLLEKYKVDMAVRDLAASTQEQYIQNLRQWFIWIMENQGNRSVLEMEDDDITKEAAAAKERKLYGEYEAAKDTEIDFLAMKRQIEMTKK